MSRHESVDTVYFLILLSKCQFHLLVVAWGILGSLWEIFESATEGLSEAACIRVAYVSIEKYLFTNINIWSNLFFTASWYR